MRTVFALIIVFVIGLCIGGIFTFAIQPDSQIYIQKSAITEYSTVGNNSLLLKTKDGREYIISDVDRK